MLRRLLAHARHLVWHILLRLVGDTAARRGWIWILLCPGNSLFTFSHSGDLSGWIDNENGTVPFWVLFLEE